VAIAISEWLQSPFLPDYLEKNLITLLIALLAINTTTSGVIMSKLKEIMDKRGGDFTATVAQLRASKLEQILMIVMAVAVLILQKSPKIVMLHQYVPFILNGLLASVFAASMHSLFDTANSIFVILQHENKK
jgi:cobalamin synthase